MEERKKIRKHMFLDGRVQGVGFRYTASYTASRLGLTGWVRNLYDGRVEMEVQGEPRSIDRMMESLNQGRFIRIEQCEETELPVIPESGFSVRG